MMSMRSNVIRRRIVGVVTYRRRAKTKARDVSLVGIHTVAVLSS